MTEEKQHIEEVDTQEEAEPVVKVAEMKRRLEQEQKKYQDEIEAMKESNQKAIEQAIAEYKAENELSGKELEKYRQQQAEAEKQKLLDQIKELELKNTRRELKDEAINTLSEKKLPVTSEVLNFVVKNTAEETLSAIDDMAKIVAAIKNDYAVSDAPMTSGGQLSSGIQADDTYSLINKLKKQS